MSAVNAAFTGSECRFSGAERRSFRRAAQLLPVFVAVNGTEIRRWVQKSEAFVEGSRVVVRR